MVIVANRIASTSLLVALFGCAGLAGPRIVAAQTSIQVQPDTVKLCPRGSALVRVTASDKDAPGYANSQLQWQTDSNVTLTKLTDSVGERKGSYGAWLLQVKSPQSEPLRPGVVHVFMSEVPANAAASLRGSASFTVQSAIAAGEFPAKAELQTSWERINEGQRARAYAVISNRSSAELRIDAIKVSAYPFEVFAVADASPLQPGKDGATLLKQPAPPTLAAGGSATYPLEIALNQEARATVGAHRMMLSVDVSGTIDGCARAATLVAQKDIAFAVLGDTSVLTAVGIPSFLLAPGFLFLMAMVLLWKVGLKPRTATAADFPITAKGTEFWTLAVTVSLVIALLPKATGFFATYRIDDVAFVWIASLAAGAFLYLLYVFVRNKVDAYNERKAQARRDAHDLSDSDDPLETLQKLTQRSPSTMWQRATVDLAKVNLGATKGPVFVFVAEKSGDQAWILPQIIFEWTAAPDPELAPRIAAARNLRNAALLAAALADGVRSKKLVVRWDPAAKLQGLRRAPVKELTETAQAELVQEEEE